MQNQNSILVETIDWSADLEFIGSGSFSVVYSVPGQKHLVMKIGSIWDEEVEAQRFFSEQHLALPVLAYYHRVKVPDKIQQALCGMHGRRLGDAGFCYCNDSNEWQLMIMPKADPVVNFTFAEIENFMLFIMSECGRYFGYYWDYYTTNIAVYEGHLIALDFGDPDHVFQ